MNICRTEYVFKDYEKALYAKKQVTKKQRKASHDVYTCPICGMYHIGPRYPKKKLERILSQYSSVG